MNQNEITNLNYFDYKVVGHLFEDLTIDLSEFSSEIMKFLGCMHDFVFYLAFFEFC